ncbi:MAG: hypothetical protein E5V85_18185 [Mesorhizobium sp.]|nr:MAG: hypothetical protein E5V90_14315 [Mesorhizobium sp.]TIV96356.1 MAG: hypothetical protein E5V85_18185 [Mesorhizobium sp.]TKB07372.1 MAG: hypothetical protein E5V75_33850 [Mesorhizobium sp.]
MVDEVFLTPRIGMPQQKGRSGASLVVKSAATGACRASSPYRPRRKRGASITKEKRRAVRFAVH